MKKILITLMACMTLLFSLVGCGSEETETIGDWWVIKDLNFDNGIPIVTHFKMADGDNTATIYDLNGQEVDTMNVIRDGDTITLDLGFTTAEFLYDGEYLYNPKTNEIEYYRCSDPGFIEQLSYDGIWYKNGDLNSEDRIEINGNEYTMSTAYGEEKNTFTYGPSIHLVSPGFEVTSLPTLDSGFPGPSFDPVYDGHILYVEDFMDEVCYVNEDYVDDPAAKAYVKMTEIFNLNWEAVLEDYTLRLNVTPHYFKIVPYAIDENGYENPNEELGTWAGTWSINSDNNGFTFEYYEGGSDSFEFVDEFIELNLENIGYIFKGY